MHCIAIFHTIDGMNLSNYLTFRCAYDIAAQQLALLGDGAGVDSAVKQKKKSEPEKYPKTARPSSRLQPQAQAL